MEFQPLGDMTRNIGYDSFAGNGGHVEFHDGDVNSGGGMNFEGAGGFGLTGYGPQQTWAGDEAHYPGSPSIGSLQVDPILPDPSYSLYFPENGGKTAYKGDQYRDGSGWPPANDTR